MNPLLHLTEININRKVSTTLAYDGSSERSGEAYTYPGGHGGDSFPEQVMIFWAIDGKAIPELRDKWTA